MTLNKLAVHVIFNKTVKQKFGGIVYNPHFWTLIVVEALIAIMYYSWIIWDYHPKWLWLIGIFELQNSFHGSLLCIPLLYSAIVFGWRGILITWLMSVGIVIPLVLYYRYSLYHLFPNILYLSIPLIVVVYITLEINWRNKERRALAERESERQNFLAQIFKAQENERKRISQELHDDTIHSLLVIASKARNILVKKNHQSIEHLLQNIKTIKDDITNVSVELRKLCLDLRPGILDNVGFVAASRWLVDQLSSEGQIDTQLIVRGEEKKIPPGADVILFRVVQEALNNIRLHSKATESVVTFDFSCEIIKISIQDNGTGFLVPDRIDSFSSKGKLGLMGIQERVRTINGNFDVQSQIGIGTTISVELKSDYNGCI